METDTEDLPGSDPHECKLREFKLKARYLLFCTSAKELPTKGNLSKLIKKAMAESGSVENIKLYCFLTPQQLGTLDESHLVFVACWGTGKTLLMITKAKELNDFGEKVLFLVFLNGKEIEEGQKNLLDLL
jgi:hypothetical protein